MSEQKKIRQQITPGAILEIAIEDGYYCYGQILKSTNIAFFDYRSRERLSDIKMLNDAPVLFIIAVYNDIITRGHWLKTGKMPIRPDLIKEPLKFIQDALHPERFELYEPITGKITPATKAECKGLERCAVWDKHHVEDRLSDHYAGRKNYERERDLKVFDD